MPAVSNSSPLILYAAIGRLNLLQAVYGEVIVPPAVWTEVVTHGAGRSGASAVAGLPWIRQQALANEEQASRLIPELGPGEAEAIALAIEFGDTVSLLLDDFSARRRALTIGLDVVGSAGVLIVAKDRGLIPAIRPLLGHLRSAGLYLSDTIERELLTIAGE